MEELLIIIILFAPLVGGFLTYSFEKNKSLASITGVLVSFLVSLNFLVSKIEFNAIFEWLPNYRIAILVDGAAILIITLVLLVSLLVHLFSLEYMKADEGRGRYFFKLGFFTFSMVGLLLADHLILLFVFWELVGLSSYLLVGFWYKKDGVSSSARTVFMVNRLADVALLIGILLLYSSGLTISEFESRWLFLPSILVVIGAFGKSAQLPFSGWLTKAMVGPTPVSALIHAATMVAAGVYLLFRVAPFLHFDALMVVAYIGTFTALYAGLCALMQHDIKKVLAYSTISQLGYMFVGIGVGAQSASLFHLFTHAFFKAGLFLGAGSIIHFMHQVTKEDGQDIRNMGGLRKELPWTYRTFLVCALALAGVPLLSGFLSKEGIIIASWEWAGQKGAWAYLVPDVALITAFLTALYVGRMVILVFWGENRLRDLTSNFTESINLRLPLVVLSIGALWFWYSWNPIAHDSWLSAYIGDDTTQASGFTSSIVTFLSLLMAAAGLVLAFAFFKPSSNYFQSYAQMRENRLTFLYNGFYLNTLYRLFGKTVEKLSKTSFLVDQKVVDGSIHLVAVGGIVFSKVIALVDRFLVDGPVNLVGQLSNLLGRLFASVSSRDSQTQLAWLLAAIILILTWILFL